MFSIEIECPAEQTDVLIAELWEAGSAGIVELNGGLRAFFENDAPREELLVQFGARSCRQEDDRDWIADSRAGFDPMCVGARFFLVPEWRSDPAPEGRFRIAVNPGMAFGTGRHETTQLCLEALEIYARPGVSLLDVGTGAGILAQAGALLEAAPVWACDIDPEAVEIARANAGPHLFIGSVDAVRGGAAGLIAANISPEAIVQLAPDLLRALAPGGVALVSGFNAVEIPAVESALAAHGATILEIRQKGDWAMLAVGVKLLKGVSDVHHQTPIS